MKTQNGQLWFLGGKKGQLSFVVLLHCSVLNVNHKKFQSSGITQFLFVVFFPENLDKIVFVILFPNSFFLLSHSFYAGRNTVELYFLPTKP